MNEIKMNILPGDYSWDGYAFDLTREVGGSWFYAIREKTPMFCLYAATTIDAISKARDAIEFYQLPESEPEQPKENSMQIVTILNPEDGSLHGHGVAVLASSVVAGQQPQCSLVAQYLARWQCEAFIDGYKARAAVESETAS